jgi:hypothetical protein
MGTLKKFADWLTGNKYTPQKMITKLTIFQKRLQRQSAKLNSQARIARRKAVEFRKKGDVSASRVHMRSSLQQTNWAVGIDNYCLQIQGLQFKLEQAKAVGDINEIMKGIAKVVGQLQNVVSAPQINELIDEIDLGMQDFDVMQEMTASGMEAMQVSTEVTDKDIDKALQEVDAEISIETGEALPSAVGDSKISDLEKEIKRLKENK